MSVLSHREEETVCVPNGELTLPEKEEEPGGGTREQTDEQTHSAPGESREVAKPGSRVGSTPLLFLFLLPWLLILFAASGDTQVALLNLQIGDPRTRGASSFAHRDGGPSVEGRPSNGGGSHFCRTSAGFASRSCPTLRLKRSAKSGV